MLNEVKHPSRAQITSTVPKAPPRKAPRLSGCSPLGEPEEYSLVTLSTSPVSGYPL